MNKTEQQMVGAVRKRLNWAGGNTLVNFENSGMGRVYLHGNLIAIVPVSATTGLNTAPEPVRSTVGEWPTAVTMSRLRALGIDARVKSGRPLINGKPL